MSHDDHGLSHISSLKTLFAVFALLLFFTAVTVGVSRFELGRWDLTIAMTIATVKAVIVSMYFMHLRYEKALNIVIFVSSILFAILFLGISALDATTYQDRIKEYRAVQPLEDN
ncbi:MAG: cytochrome C oxidase subunit IV family protein [Planctomycetota bacterium]